MSIGDWIFIGVAAVLLLMGGYTGWNDWRDDLVLLRVSFLAASVWSLGFVFGLGASLMKAALGW